MQIRRIANVFNIKKQNIPKGISRIQIKIDNPEWA